MRHRSPLSRAGLVTPALACVLLAGCTAPVSSGAGTVDRTPGASAASLASGAGGGSGAAPDAPGSPTSPAPSGDALPRAGDAR